MNEPKEVQVDSAFNVIVTIVERVNNAMVAVDISAASAKAIYFQSPDGTGRQSLSSVTFVTDGTNGQIQATVSATINDTIGTARVQGLVTIAGLPYYSIIASIEVLANLPAS